ncbi:uncharacterized protein LOC142813926 [Rhipicephalus microplus]|uniref:uncharacterized protein LOC142813926 n=1 Tax=Rhipicephalus microplus TaxID=6941 RepID=UPI003F6A57BF
MNSSHRPPLQRCRVKRRKHLSVLSNQSRCLGKQFPGHSSRLLWIDRLPLELDAESHHSPHQVQRTTSGSLKLPARYKGTSCMEKPRQYGPQPLHIKTVGTKQNIQAALYFCPIFK